MWRIPLDTLQQYVNFTDNRSIRIAVLTLFVVAGLLLPHALNTHYTNLASRIFIWAILATAYNFAFGFGNIVSFGHAGFVATGAYGVSVSLVHAEAIPFVGSGLAIPIAIALIVTLMFSVAIGVFAVRGYGIYFAMITFAFAELIHQAIAQADLTQGNNGIILPPTDLPFGLVLDPDLVFYTAFVSYVGLLLVSYRILNSPFGRAMAAIKSNENRAEYIGYPVNRIKIAAFSLSGLFTGVGGIIYILNFQFISPDIASTHTTIDMLIMTIIGGMNTLLGPGIGAAFIVSLRYLTRNLAEYGEVIIGVAFVLVIIYMNQGVYGKAKEVWESSK